ncbi:aldo/keto reductase [Alsobacter sp. SYSU M60028]|uniref:Aldo/keto reductase n=1 Tax=Alsobacter ponti TaxID=2962936 RepID=A0ABT1L9K2_9HYPH|nr:aldo/keto reductase [Alsobacter ponti]MCP8938160.1 aldo/keto reductase [Alsobacter ponti]
MTATSTPAAPRPERAELAPGLEISRIVTGLWQVADQERGGAPLDREAASSDMLAYAAAGFDTFDMADHYGSAELIAGRMLARAAAGEGGLARRPLVFTKWCPTPGPMTADVVRAGVRRSLDRLGVSRVDLLQFHWWSFEHPSYLDAVKGLADLREEGLIGQIGVTNFDTAHLRVLVRHGLPVVSNQVSFSVLDRRAAGEMSAFCLENDVRLMAYGTLAGGLLSERWLGSPEPAADDISDWSKMKYRRFVDAVGGWAVLQTVLRALDGVARRHGVSIANVATRYVLEHQAVAGVIVGARLTEREHRADNLRNFAFALDGQDRADIASALAATTPVPGDCGDEYRRPPFLTASGDLSHHLEAMPRAWEATPVEGRPERLRVDTGSIWEPLCGYSRAVRVRDRVLVSGTTATNGAGEIVCRGDPAGQTVFILDKIAASLAACGATLADVVRTRVYVKDASQWEPVARAHGRYFGDIRPANTMIEIANLIGDYEVEIEAEAVVD